MQTQEFARKVASKIARLIEDAKQETVQVTQQMRKRRLKDTEPMSPWAPGMSRAPRVDGTPAQPTPKSSGAPMIHGLPVLSGLPSLSSAETESGTRPSASTALRMWSRLFLRVRLAQIENERLWLAWQEEEMRKEIVAAKKRKAKK